MRSGPLPGGLVVGVEQRALVDRQAAAADARGEPVAHCLEGPDPAVEVLAPAAGEPFPVAARRGARGGERVERGPDPLERDPGGAAGLDQRDPAQDGTAVAPLVAVGSACREQALSLVEPERGRSNAAPGGELADRQLCTHLTSTLLEVLRCRRARPLLPGLRARAGGNDGAG